jgi:hypothetical protein
MKISLKMSQAQQRMWGAGAAVYCAATVSSCMTCHCFSWKLSVCETLHAC